MQQLRFFGPVLLLMLAACAAKPPTSSELDVACNEAAAKLEAVDKLTFSRREGVFDYWGKSFQGCILTSVGDKTTITTSQFPEALFYPAENSEQARAGWRADNEADGPDGTAFRIMRGNVFCAVEGRWDGGDDSDPTYVPSTRVEFRVQCGTIKP